VEIVAAVVQYFVTSRSSYDIDHKAHSASGLVSFDRDTRTAADTGMISVTFVGVNRFDTISPGRKVGRHIFDRRKI